MTRATLRLVPPSEEPATEESGVGEAVTECELDAAPETVWRALTEPHLIADWLGIAGPAEVTPLDHSGAAFAPAPDLGAVAVEVVEADPPRRLAWAWREAGGPDSRVTFDLEPAGEGRTRLRIVHRVDEDLRRRTTMAAPGRAPVVCRARPPARAAPVLRRAA